MKVKCYLTVNEHGYIRVSKGKPNLKMDEISIALNLEIPEALFLKPTLEANISIPEEVAVSDKIDIETQDNIKEAIETATGVNVRISVSEEVNQ